MKTTFIYALCEPETRTVRYIGKTSAPEKRLKDHIRDSSKTTTHLGNWLRSLLSQGQHPTMIVLRNVEGDGSEAEIRYIRLARGCGIRLTNSTDGGEGVTMTPEIRRKIADKNKGPFTLAHRAALSAAQRGIKRKPRTPEHCAALSRSLTGNPKNLGRKKAPRSPSHCAALSAVQKGVPKPWSEARRAAFERSKQRDQEIEWALSPYTLD